MVPYQVTSLTVSHVHVLINSLYIIKITVIWGEDKSRFRQDITSFFLFSMIIFLYYICTYRLDVGLILSYMLCSVLTDTWFLFELYLYCLFDSMCNLNYFKPLMSFTFFYTIFTPQNCELISYTSIICI